MVREKRVEAARRKKLLEEAQNKAQQKAQFDLFGEEIIYEETETEKETVEKPPQFDLF
jgi:hypothetical protein